MSLLSVIFIVSVLFNVLNTAHAISCPATYNDILNGCYKMNNGTKLTWSDAQQYCLNDSSLISTNKTGFVTHLVAFESAVETTSVVYWMKAWGIASQFWTDGVASSASWSWSNQALTWYFNASDQLIAGNGSNYRIVYSTAAGTYQVVDDSSSKLSYFICEYQERCPSNNSCQNNATCYLNVGRELCVCAPGYTGTVCSQEIDECLSSPCQHGGTCTDGPNNYTCDCSNIFFQGPNCETPKEDPTQGQRSTAFWSVFGVICGLVALLTLSDLPWDEIATTVGCPWYRFKCCSHDDDDDDDEHKRSNNSDSPAHQRASVSKQLSMPGKTVKGVNYHVMNTVWNPDQLQSETPTHPQYNGYVSPDPKTTPNNVLIQSFAAVVLAKQKQQASDENRVYALDILPQNDTPVKPRRPVDTMITWTHQLQEQLKNKSARPTSSDSTRELVDAESKDEN